MIIDFNNIPEQSIPNFKGGEGAYDVHMYFDGTNRIMKGRLQPGSSIGIHTHTDNNEMIFLTHGTATVIYDGERLTLQAGQCHYCPKGHTHSLINESEEDIQFLAVVA